MSRYFYAVHRETGERWKPSTNPHINSLNQGYSTFHQYLIMYDSGRLAVVTEAKYKYHNGSFDPWEYVNETSITPLDMKYWKPVIRESMNKLVERFKEDT